jgi:stage IV sporulation protein FB
MVTEFISLSPEAPLDRAVEALLRTTQHEFPVVDSSGSLAGILTRDDIIRGLRESGPQAIVASVMHRDVHLVQHNASFDVAFRHMQECQCPALGVVNGEGQLIGLITPEAISEMMMIRSVMPRDGKPSWRQDQSAKA